MGTLSEVLDAAMVGKQINPKDTRVFIYLFIFIADVLGLTFTFESPENSNAGYQSDSCWPVSAVRAMAAAAPTPVPIDWTALRENRDKYEAIKWQGECRVSSSLDDVIIT